jgi:tRNA pseudouridine38-40 synthase
LNTYKAKFSYNGHRFEGWQTQQHTDLTVQGQINKVLKKISKDNELVHSLGSGRTDSGVHALAQVCKISLPLSIGPVALRKGLNSQLPKDIRCLSVETCDSSFHPVRDALWKSYDYIVFTGEVLSPLLNTQVTPYRYSLDHDLMRRALMVMEGEKDFVNFSTKGTEVSSTVRTLHSAKLFPGGTESFAHLFLDESFLRFRFTGSGFLKQMVRLLVSAVLECGRGRISVEEIESFFSKETDLKIAPTGKADGLYLSHVEYEDAWRPSIDNRLQSR